MIPGEGFLQSGNAALPVIGFAGGTSREPGLIPLAFHDVFTLEARDKAINLQEVEGYGEISVRNLYQSIEARRTITDVLEKLPKSEKQLLPDIGPTVTGLVERIISLAGGLHQLDEDASPEAIARLDQRLADAQALPDGAPDKERSP